MFISQIRKLALFEFIDTTSITNWMKGVLGMPTEEDEDSEADVECDPELSLESCDASTRRRRRML